MNIDDVISAMRRKAIGYETSEKAEEYATVDGELTLIKRKVTTKEVPPDVSAARLLMEANGDVEKEMTEAEIETEKLRLLRLLKEIESGGKTENGTEKT